MKALKTVAVEVQGDNGAAGGQGGLEGDGVAIGVGRSDLEPAPRQAYGEVPDAVAVHISDTCHGRAERQAC